MNAKARWGFAGVVAIVLFVVAVPLLYFNLEGYTRADYHSLENLVQLLPWYEHPKITVLSSSNVVDSEGRTSNLVGLSGTTCGFFTRGCFCGPDQVMLWEPFVISIPDAGIHCDRFVMLVGDISGAELSPLSKATSRAYIRGVAYVYRIDPNALNLYILYDRNFKLAESLGLSSFRPGKEGYSDAYFLMPAIFVLTQDGTVVWLDRRIEGSSERPSAKVLKLYLALAKVMGDVR